MHKFWVITLTNGVNGLILVEKKVKLLFSVRLVFLGKVRDEAFRGIQLPDGDEDRQRVKCVARDAW